MNWGKGNRCTGIQSDMHNFMHMCMHTHRQMQRKQAIKREREREQRELYLHYCDWNKISQIITEFSSQICTNQNSVINKKIRNFTITYFRRYQSIIQYEESSERDNNITYIFCMNEPLHWTPCHPCPHGSPPLETHPGMEGDPSATCKLLIAATDTIRKF